MKIISILENTSEDHRLIAKHGLSLFIKTNEITLLFDTGPDRSYITNAEKLDLNLTSVDKIIISHGHSDHIGSCHCTGKKGLKLLKEVLADKIQPMPTGTTLEILEKKI